MSASLVFQIAVFRMFAWPTLTCSWLAVLQVGSTEFGTGDSRQQSWQSEDCSVNFWDFKFSRRILQRDGGFCLNMGSQIHWLIISFLLWLGAIPHFETFPHQELHCCHQESTESVYNTLDAYTKGTCKPCRALPKRPGSSEGGEKMHKVWVKHWVRNLHVAGHFHNYINHLCCRVSPLLLSVL